MKKLECVILLRGNFVVVRTSEDKKKELNDLLQESKKNSVKDQNFFLVWEDDITIIAK